MGDRQTQTLSLGQSQQGRPELEQEQNKGEEFPEISLQESSQGLGGGKDEGEKENDNHFNVSLQGFPSPLSPQPLSLKIRASVERSKAIILEQFFLGGNVTF